VEDVTFLKPALNRVDSSYRCRADQAAWREDDQWVRKGSTRFCLIPMRTAASLRGLVRVQGAVVPRGVQS
jgi:hypothetical protein